MATFAIAPVSAGAVEKIRNKMLRTPTSLRKVLGDAPTIVIATDSGEVALELQRQDDVTMVNGNGVLPLNVKCGDTYCRANLHISLLGEAKLVTFSQWDEAIIAQAVKTALVTV